VTFEIKFSFSNKGNGEEYYELLERPINLTPAELKALFSDVMPTQTEPVKGSKYLKKIMNFLFCCSFIPSKRILLRYI
jgi:hypothetical protein